MTLDPQALLRQLFDSAIEAAHPRHVLADHLPEDRSGRAIVIGAGKAAAAMAEAIEKVWEGELSGLVVTRYEHHADCRRIEVVEAAHPVPDDAGERVARRVLELVSNLEESDRVIFLLSAAARHCWHCRPKASRWRTSRRSTRRCCAPARTSAR